MNTVYVAAWNSTMALDSFKDKRDLYLSWLQWFTKLAGTAPSLVVLIEASPYMPKDKETLDLGYQCVGHVDTQAEDGGVDKDQIAKSLVAFWRKNNSAIECPGGTTLKFPGLKDAIRAVLKINLTVKGGAAATLWFVHANASKSGGTAMTQAAYAELAKSPRTAVMGDLNLNFPALEKPNDFKGKAVPPLSYQKQGQTAAQLAFTNWNRSSLTDNTAADYARWGVVIPQGGPTRFQTGGVLDYALASDTLTVTALPSMADVTMFSGIFRQFDHFPVIYKVEW